MWKIWRRGITLNEGGRIATFTITWKDRIYVYLSYWNPYTGKWVRHHN